MKAIDRSNAEQLAKNIVLAQGNIFIKELLRKKKITIGATKADFEKNMLAAIAEDKLSFKDLCQWLATVEGWGNQHIYLFKVPENVAIKSIWKSPSKLRNKFTNARMSKYWEANSSLEFPDKRELTGIYFRKLPTENGGYDGSLCLQWHRGLTSWIRDPSKDRIDKKIAPHYTYWFRAYRERRDRAVMRFEIRPDQRLAAAFIQTPWSKKAHKEALDEISKRIAPVLDLSALTKYSTAKAIKGLDTKAAKLSTGKTSVRAELTRLSDGKAYVEFAGPNGVYRNSTALLSVRRAVNLKSFSGNTGIYLYNVHRPTGAGPDIKIELFGESRRIRIHVQLGAAAVWELLGMLKPLG